MKYDTSAQEDSWDLYTKEVSFFDFETAKVIK